MLDHAIGSDHHHRACHQALQGAVDQLDSERRLEGVVAEPRPHDDVLDALGSAETARSEGKVLGDAEDRDAGKGRRLLVELAHGGGAHPGVDAREDVEDDGPAREGRRIDGRQILSYKGECRRFRTRGGEFSVGVDGGALECGGCHLRSFHVRGCFTLRYKGMRLQTILAADSSIRHASEARLPSCRERFHSVRERSSRRASGAIRPERVPDPSCPMHPSTKAG